MDTYHPFDWTVIPVGNSGAFPLPHEVRLNPIQAWWTLPKLETNTPQARAIASVMEPTRYRDGVITPGVMQGYYSFGEHRGWFAESGEVPARVIGPVVEHFPPGALTWPDDIKPQFRVPDHTGVHYHSSPWFASGGASVEWHGAAAREGSWTSDGIGDADWFGTTVSEGVVDADGEGDAEWSGEGGGTVVREATFTAHGAGSASFYSDNPIKPSLYPGFFDGRDERPRPPKQIIRARMDLGLPAFDGHIKARVVPVPQIRATMNVALPPLQQQALARVSVSAELVAGTPPIEGEIRSGVAARASMTVDLFAAESELSARPRTGADIYMELPALSFESSSIARVSSSMTVETPNPVSEIRVDEDDFTDDALLAAARALLEAEEEED